MSYNVFPLWSLRIQKFPNNRPNFTSITSQLRSRYVDIVLLILDLLTTVKRVNSTSNTYQYLFVRILFWPVRSSFQDIRRARIDLKKLIKKQISLCYLGRARAIRAIARDRSFLVRIWLFQ